MSRALDGPLGDMSLSPTTVSTYLGVSGWELEDTRPGVETWLLREGRAPQARVLLPIDDSFVDYRRRFQEALERLRVVYDWDDGQLVSNILATRSDLFYIRADQQIWDESIPIKQAEQLISGAVKLIQSAARSSVDPRASYKGTYPREVRKFMEDDVRMGHTRRGSFIITVLTRLANDEIFEPESLDETSTGEYTRAELPAIAADTLPTPSQLRSQDQLVQVPQTREVIGPPFQRRVTATLANALYAAVNIARSGRTFVGDDAINSGVSANLCDSLLDMTKHEGLHSLDLTFRWAPGEVIQPPRISEITLDHEDFEPIRSMGSRLRERDDPERLTVIGRVVKLVRSEESDDPNEATITLRGTVRDARRQVRMTLSGEAHDLAISAYREQFLVQATGDLQRSSGGGLVLSGNISVDAVHK